MGRSTGAHGRRLSQPRRGRPVAGRGERVLGRPGPPAYHLSVLRILPTILACAVLFAWAAPASAARGQWTPLAPTSLWNSESVHMALLPGAAGHHSRLVRWTLGSGQIYDWDPTATEGCADFPASFTDVPGWSAGAELYCAGMTQLADGRLLTAGGHDVAVDGLVQWGIADARTYSPATGTWTAKPGILHPRWYPTATTLRDGRVLVTSGNRGGQLWFWGGRRDGAPPDVTNGTLVQRFGRVTGGMWDEPVTPLVDGGLPAPAPREGHTAIYLSDASIPDLHGQAIFGGRDAAGAVDNEVWLLRRLIGDWANAEYEYRWKRLDMPPAGRPDPRHEHTAVARSNTEMLVFGGIQTPAGGPEQMSAELWRLVGDTFGSWQWQPLAAGPGARWGHVALHDPAGNRMIVFGGAESLDGLSLAESRVWSYEYGAGVWSELPVKDDATWRVPSPRRDHAMVRTGSGEIFLYGGWLGATESSDTLWRLNLAVTPAEWSVVATTGPSPGPRAGHSASWDADLLSDRLLIYGGESAPSATVDDDVYAIEPLAATKQWTRFAAAGFRLSGHSALMDPYGAPFSRKGEMFDPATDTWTLLNANGRFETYYPLHFLVPGSPSGGGRVLSVGQEPLARYVDIPATGDHGPWLDFGTYVPGVGNSGDAGFWPFSAVQYEPGKILIAGGYPGFGSVPVGTAKILDASDVANGWVATGSLSPRYFHNLVLLPGGEVLAVGGALSTSIGSIAAVPCPQMWSPATGTWTPVNDLACDRDNGVNVLRNYHSTALLLPDGRVISAGGVISSYRFRARVFCPPYLFGADGVTPATRPVIADWPREIGWGGTFRIATPDAADVQKVALVRPAATTHGFDENQRYVPLTIVARNPGELVVAAPPSPDHAPPGYYMLFLVGAMQPDLTLQADVPSLAQWVNIGCPECVSPVATPVATPSSGFALAQNRPNPFRGTTEIGFSLPVESRVRVEVFDVSGRRLAVLADREYSAGAHTVEWDLRGAGGRRVSAGIYVYRMSAGAFSAERKMTVLP